MKGSEKVIERLNEALLLELGAVNQYWLHYRMLDDWGLGKLAKKERELREIDTLDSIIFHGILSCSRRPSAPARAS